MTLHPINVRQALLRDPEFRKKFAERFPEVEKDFASKTSCAERHRVCFFLVQSASPADQEWLRENMPATVGPPDQAQDTLRAALGRIEERLLRIEELLADR